MIQTVDKKDQDLPEHLDKWSRLDFDGADKPKNEESPHVDPASLKQASKEQKQEPELEPLNFDDEEPVNIEVSENSAPSVRPFQKKPLPKLMLGLFGAASTAVAIGLFISAGSKDADKILTANAAKTQDEVTPSNLPSSDPRDQTIGKLQSDQASTRLKEKMDALNQRKAAEAKLKAKKDKGTRIASAPVTPTYQSLPAPSNDPVPFRSASRVSDPIPSTPAYRPTPVAQNYEPLPQKPKVEPKLLAFGGMPEEKASAFTGSSSGAVQPVSGPVQTTGYTPVAYTPQSQGGISQSTQGFDSQGNTLQDQQRAFLGGDRQARISANESASGTVTSGAILPGRFSVQIDSPLSGIPAGTTIIFETKTVYPNGKVEAYAIGATSGDYQRLQPIPVGAISLLSDNGKLLKAQKPSAGFMSSFMGRGLLGAVQGAAGRFLSTSSVISQSSSGTLVSQGAGGKGFSDLAAGALQGGISPLLQSLPQQTTTNDKSFSIEPGKKVTVKVLQPFTFSF